METMRKFFFYEDDEGKMPVLDAMKALKEPEHKMLRRMIDALELSDKMGGYFKPFKGKGTNFGELKLGDFRIFVSEVAPKQFIMLHLFRKKSNETPRKEESIALRRLDKWRIRREH